jgi:hypothetical protein
MQITIHKEHGITIEDVGDTPVDIVMRADGTVSVDINFVDGDGDNDDDLEPDPYWSDSMLGRMGMLDR